MIIAFKKQFEPNLNKLFDLTTCAEWLAFMNRADSHAPCGIYNIFYMKYWPAKPH